ncbi:MAG: DegT/DnrJ/EryC1/StrS family aminotransferase [Gammaproteobacteria bacterium]|nr:DegT/DnrJ/EryC1/StrS family aminotransferase [Gammaproteobacteria bacterium]MBU2058347.1 DegT/DnrJ/EryC1/StrS family aminotransferase [Gammaproteobacteria bacterium]MBU2176600.1 DegT/DnrJ/EryC1/StrS family aminotransferase [Gammaproteobacteria bacterium]MBU2248458.1 DegT/DnrJ/EryC1/StrS family aminotransferase [Gammaproteobacteria bacterium]MBU2345679.1 DegT/DnrJ/EryC1/StrS family aminotransferase [Gammaproteobacteria bacterium]
MTDKPIYVTQPALPPLEEFIPYLQQIWDNKILTNCGPFHQQLELALAEYLGVKYISLFANATLALVTALQALRITGDVITTPYSFVATAHSLKWNGIRPIFVDIDPKTCNLDPAAIEAAITPQTTAIMPVHVYGTPCDVEAIQRIAENYNLKVIYDAAHAFGCKVNGQSLCSFGDISVVSFHATKVFNTFEGGAIICQDAKTKAHIDHLKNFGFVDETTVVAAGINGKMSEINAAFGMLQLKHIDAAIAKRAQISKFYNERLRFVRGISILQDNLTHESNYSYFPILVDADYPITRDALYNQFREKNIMARRYFYPLISEFPMYRGLPSATARLLPNAKEISSRVICLPLHPHLEEAELEKVMSVIVECARKPVTKRAIRN